MPLNKDQRNALIDAVTQSALESAQKSSLLELLNEKKRYGLVWEDKPEHAKERMKHELPVLVDVPERYVEGASPDSPHHVLIEGDNYNALTALQYTHTGKVDVIYIDPPYNTGNKDFSYHDTFHDEPEFIDREHRFRHSTWLSFMEKRLKLAKVLLKETGVIFISIDDNEQAQLKLLCDEIFGEGNHSGTICWFKKRKGSFLSKTLISLTEYVHIFSKQPGKQLVGGKPDNTESQPLIKRTNSKKELKFPSNTVKTKLSDGLYSPGLYGEGSSASELLNEITVSNGIIQNTFSIIAPFVWGQENLDSEIKNGTDIIINTTNFQPRALRHNNDSVKGLPSLIDGREQKATNEDAYEFIQDLFQAEGVFNYSKPVNLIKILLMSGSFNDNSALILDFFAGSGTTLHATMALNAEDGGKRQCILVTNNENNICEQVTYERNKRVIQGYTNSKGQAVEGLKDNHLHYFKVDFTPSEKSVRNQRTLTTKLADILRLKENAFTTVHSDLEKVRIWKNDQKHILLVQDVTAIADAVQWIAQQESPCKVYVFAPGAYPFIDDFAEVENQVELIAMPEAYRDAIEFALPTQSLLSQGGAE